MIGAVGHGTRNAGRGGDAAGKASALSDLRDRRVMLIARSDYCMQCLRAQYNAKVTDHACCL